MTNTPPALPAEELVSSAVVAMLDSLGYYASAQALGVDEETKLAHRDNLAALVAAALPARVTRAAGVVESFPWAQLDALQRIDADLVVHLLNDEEWVADHPHSAPAVREDLEKLHRAFPQVGTWAK